MSLKKNIENDIKLAMKATQTEKLKTLRLMMAEIKQIEIDERKNLSDEEILPVLSKMIKQRQDSINQYKAGNRADLVKIEASEIDIIESYLPEKLSADEIEKIIQEAIKVTKADKMSDMGNVMKIIQIKAQGRTDMGMVSKKVKSLLAS